MAHQTAPIDAYGGLLFLSSETLSKDLSVWFTSLAQGRWANVAEGTFSRAVVSTACCCARMRCAKKLAERARAPLLNSASGSGWLLCRGRANAEAKFARALVSACCARIAQSKLVGMGHDIPLRWCSLAETIPTFNEASVSALLGA